MTTQRSGAVTLLAVFLTTMVAFLVLLGENLHAIDERHRAHAEVVTEQAFYASQSCLEEAYLQKRGNAGYTGDTNITVGLATCTVIASATADGTITSTGSDQTISRVIASNYKKAGGTTVSTPAAIMHVIDRTGSMANDSFCSDPAFTTQSTCHSPAVWHVEPMDTTKDAAESFVNKLATDASDHAIGVVSYNTTASLTSPYGIGLTHRAGYPSVNSIIENLPAPSGRTNIGDALALAASQLPVSAGSRRYMVLLTDGVPNEPFGDDTPEHKAESIQYTKDKAQAVKDSGIILFTIGLGSGADGTLLTDMASIIGGHAMYFPAHTAGDLDTIYAQIFDTIVVHNLKQGSWNEQ